MTEGEIKSEGGLIPRTGIIRLSQENIAEALGQREEWLPQLTAFFQRKFKTGQDLSELMERIEQGGHLVFTTEDGEIKSMVACSPYYYQGVRIEGTYSLGCLANQNGKIPLEEIVLRAIEDVPQNGIVIAEVDMVNEKHYKALMNYYKNAVGFEDYLAICSEKHKIEWTKLNRHPLYSIADDLRQNLTNSINSKGGDY